MLFSTGALLSYVSRTADVLAMTSASGPAAATSSFLEATPKRVAVGLGRSERGHGEDSSCSFVSPAIERKPTA